MYTTVASGLTSGETVTFPGSVLAPATGSYQPYSGSNMMRVASAPSLASASTFSPGIGSPGTYARTISGGVLGSSFKERQVGTVVETQVPRYVERPGSLSAPSMASPLGTGGIIKRSGSITSPMPVTYVAEAPTYVDRVVNEAANATLEYVSVAPTVEYLSPTAVEYVTPAPAVEYVSAKPVVETVVKSTVSEEIRQLTLQLSTERSQRQSLEAQLASVFAQMNTIVAELDTCKARLDKIDPPFVDTPLRVATRLVEQRGNLQVNHSSGHVMILRPLKFEPRTTKEKPTAVFIDVAVAEAVCKDLAELSNIFNCPMTIEGHTKGGESQFWQQLADNRARVVVELMIDLGANRNLLHAQGKPGRLGKNEVRTEVFMDINNIADERAAVMEVDVVQNGRIVERDLYQAGHLVERDRGQTTVLERDVVTSGGVVVEKDIYARNTQDRQLVGLSGKSVEHERVITDSAAVVRAAPATIVRAASPLTVTRPAVYP